MAITLVAICNHDLALNGVDVKGLFSEIQTRLKTLSSVNGEALEWEFVKDEILSIEMAWESAGELHFVSSKIALNKESYFIINLYVGINCYSLFTGVTWASFFEVKDVAKKIIEVTMSLGHAMGGSAIIYLPDSGSKCSGYDGLVSLGYSLDEIQQEMMLKCGEPAASSEELSQNRDVYSRHERYIVMKIQH